LRKLPEPVGTSRHGCVSVGCVDLRDSEKVCECSREDGSVGLTLQARDRVVNEWNGDVPGPIGTNSFTALVGDLDADGKDEIIVVNLQVVSNGMAVQTYGVAILDGRDRRRPPVRFEVQEFGEHDTFRYSASQQTCEILVTSWENGHDSERGWGLYMVGQWYRYREGTLVPDATRPVLSRRYLNSLQRERFANMNKPFAWLKRASTVESETFLPSFLGLSLTKTETGRLLHATGGRLEVQLAGESPRQLEAWRNPWFSDMSGRPDFQSVYSLLADERTLRL